MKQVQTSSVHHIEVNGVNVINSIILNECGIEAVVYRTSDKGTYSVKLGGYYNCHLPLNEAIELAQKQMLRVSEQRIKREVKRMKQIVNKQLKQKP